MKKPIDEHYIQRLVAMLDGGLMILTCLSALMKLLNDTRVTSFETDMTFRQVAGKLNEWEVVIFLKVLERVAFKRFVARDNILAMNSDMEATQVLGAAHSFLKMNDPKYSQLSNNMPGEQVALEICHDSVQLPGLTRGEPGHVTPHQLSQTRSRHAIAAYLGLTSLFPQVIPTLWILTGRSYYAGLYDCPLPSSMESLLSLTPIGFPRSPLGLIRLDPTRKLSGPSYSSTTFSVSFLVKSTRADTDKIIKLCPTHAKRAVLDFKSLVSREDYDCLMDFVYIDSAEKLEDFSDFMRGLGVKKIQDWWDHKAMSPWILPCLIKSQSPISTEDCDNTPVTTNTGLNTGVKLSVVEAIESGRKLDEWVVRGIKTSIQTGILVNSQNESSHRVARNATQQSTTMRKAHECHEQADERYRLQSEIEALQDSQKRGSVQLKALKAQKSAVGKGSMTKSNTLRTVFVSANSSGRVKTKIIGIVLFLIGSNLR
ncbi:hypothetical protein C8R44DRAFT_730271 [Mycena epipterygia]|nr:hypothetical protein C8R44DRAFT_730271 [Mycena epipterygia]